jgi:hypothetical protein
MSIRVTLPYNPEDWRPLTWAVKNCPSYITNERNFKVGGLTKVKGGWVNTIHIDYLFSDEKDATAFSLRWS